MLPAATETVSVAGFRSTLQVAPGEVTSFTGEFAAGVRTALVDIPESVIKVEKMSVWRYFFNTYAYIVNN